VIRKHARTNPKEYKELSLERKCIILLPVPLMVMWMWMWMWMWKVILFLRKMMQQQHPSSFLKVIPEQDSADNLSRDEVSYIIDLYFGRNLREMIQVGTVCLGRRRW